MHFFGNSSQFLKYDKKIDSKSTDFKNHNQPRELFGGYEVTTSIIPKDTFKLKTDIAQNRDAA